VKKKGVIGTLLTQAIYLAEPDMVEAILEHGANPNLSNAGDGQSPLYIAVRAHVHVHTHTHNGARVLNERARSCWWPSSRDTDEVFQALGPRDPEHPPYQEAQCIAAGIAQAAERVRQDESHHRPLVGSQYAPAFHTCRRCSCACVTFLNSYLPK
jgi:hypothetical protein